ncbi:MAG: DUF465 domain-containing protein [Rickettsiales bacterium]|nr:MAG: DUF465 domain-containing protein [Rickettsiales bacterium]
MIDQEKSKYQELVELELEHNDLNEIIDDPVSHNKFSKFTLQRLKKRKLHLKDKIRILKSELYPDIIA